MRDSKSSDSNYAKRALVAQEIEKIDIDWRRRYEEFLDINGREPRAIDARSLAYVSAFFVVSWGLSTWQGVTQLTPLIATTAIVSVASLRFNEFERQYRQYRERRAEVAALG